MFLLRVQIPTRRGSKQPPKVPPECCRAENRDRGTKNRDRGFTHWKVVTECKTATAVTRPRSRVCWAARDECVSEDCLEFKFLVYFIVYFILKSIYSFLEDNFDIIIFIIIIIF